MTAQILYAIGKNSNEGLAFLDGAGFTTEEIISTHMLGWELDRLFKSYREKPQPFDFRLFIVGFKGKGDDGGEPLPVLEAAA